MAALAAANSRSFLSVGWAVISDQRIGKSFFLME
jgi:hypothetical protein